MSRGINKAIIVGTLGDEPTTRCMPNGTAVTNISVATNESWKDKQTGAQKESTEWHRIAMFGRLAEIAAEYLHQGSQVYIEGKIKTTKYEKDGVTRYSTEIIAHEMQMLGAKQSGTTAPQTSAPTQAAPTRGTAPNPNPLPSVSKDELDDSIPF